MCNPMAYAAIAASTAQQIGQYQMGKAAHEQSKSFAERNAVNARKAFYQTLKDLTARGQQEQEIIAKNTQQLTAKIGQRRAAESQSAGENLVSARLMDNTRAQLWADANAMSQAAMSRRNINSMARSTHAQQESRINQGWSQVPVKPTFGIGNILGIGAAGLQGYASGKAAGINEWSDIF